MAYYSRAVYTVTTPEDTFQVPFEYLLKEHVEVYVTEAGGSGELGDLQEEGVDYEWPSAASIHFLTGNLTTGTQVSIRRATPTESLITRLQQGTLSVNQLNSISTQLLYIAQESQDLTSGLGEQAIKFPEGDISITLPSKADRANKFMGFDGSGNFYVSAPSFSVTYNSVVNALGYVPGPSGQVTYGAVVAALGYVPGEGSGGSYVLTAGAITAALGYTPGPVLTSLLITTVLGFTPAPAYALNSAKISVALGFTPVPLTSPNIIAALGYTPAAEGSGGGGGGDVTTAELIAAVAPKADRYPVGAYSPLAEGYERALQDFQDNFINPVTNRLYPTNGGGMDFGLVNKTALAPSVWQMWAALNTVYEAWKLTGDARYGTQIENQWTYLQSVVPAGDLRTGNNGVSNIVDDACVHAFGLMQIADYYGPTTTEGARALGYLVESIAYALQRWRDPLQTGGDLFDYGVTTPTLGTALKSTRYGTLYAAADEPSVIGQYGYRSSSIEAAMGLAALYASRQASLPTPLRNGFRSYAINCYDHINLRMRTPAPADSTRTAQGLYAAMFNLDPNVNANNNPAVNGGAALNTVFGYDVNQVYHQSADAYFGKPIRELTHLWDCANHAMAALAADLYSETADDDYLDEALSVTAALPLTNGFGRVRDGITYLGNLRDPHSNGWFLPIMMRYCQDLPGWDVGGVFRSALLNTAKKVLTSSVNGYLSPNWGGPERNPNNNTYTWEDSAATQGNTGGGQAKREQIMVAATALAMVQAAVMCGDLDLEYGSGIEAPVSIESLAAEVQSLKLFIREVMTRSGGNLTGPLSIKDIGFRLDNIGGNPFLNWDNQCLDTFDRANARREFYIGNDRKLLIGGADYGILSKGPIKAANDELFYMGKINDRSAVAYAVGIYTTVNVGGTRHEFITGDSLRAYIDSAGIRSISGVYAENSGDLSLRNISGRPAVTLGAGSYVHNSGTNTLLFVTGDLGRGRVDAQGIVSYGGLYANNDAFLSLTVNSGKGTLMLDNGYMVQENSAGGSLDFYTAGVARGYFNAGAFVSKAKVVAEEDIQLYIGNVSGRPAFNADSGDSMQYDRANNRWLFVIGNTIRAYIDTAGFHNGAP